MNIKQHIIALAAVLLPLLANAQQRDTLLIDFETPGQYSALGVYDSWADSPFNTQPSLANFAVVDNIYNQPDPVSLKTANPSAHIVGIERSILGSNLFGLRVDLNQPFMMPDNSTRYVHVKMYREAIEGRVMLIGLGRHSASTPDYENTWASQPATVEQFTVLGNQKPTPGYWSDIVFPIKCAGNVEIHSLVIVVDCEAPHRLADDHIVYLDDIAINDRPRPSIAPQGDYPVSFEREDVVTRNNRSFNYVTVVTSDGTFVKKAQGKLGLTEAFDSFIPVQRGTTVRVTPNFSGNSMHSYVYFDRTNDGRFDEEDPTEFVGTRRNFNDTHTFTIPADLRPGVYRMRTKIDWDCTDPAGNTASGNFILDNGGGMIDVLLYVHDGGNTVNVSASGRNGDIVTADDQPINNLPHERNTALRVKGAPADDFLCGGMVIRVGSGFVEDDSLYHSNPQYLDVKAVTYRSFDDEGMYTIPAELFYADMRIMGIMVEAGKLAKPAFIPSSMDPIDGRFRASSRAMTIKVKGGYLTLDSVDVDQNLKLTCTTEPTTARGYWVVCGDDEQGYQVYNAGVGPSKVLGCINREQNARFKLYPANNIPAGVETYFDYKASTFTNPYHTSSPSRVRALAAGQGDATPVLETSEFNSTFRLHGTEHNCWNDRDSYLALWDSDQAFSNNGSSIEVHDVVFDFDNIEEPTPTAPARYTIQLASDPTLYLTTTDFNNNGQLSTTYCVQSTPEEFYLEPNSEGQWTIQSASTQKYVGHSHAWDVTNTTDTWTIASIDGTPTGIFRSGTSGLGIDPNSGVYTNKNNIMWIITQVEDETPADDRPQGTEYYIRNANNTGYVAADLTSTLTVANTDGAAHFIQVPAGTVQYNNETVAQFTLYNVTAEAYVGLAQGKSLNNGEKIFTNVQDAAAATPFIYYGDDIIPAGNLTTNVNTQPSWNWHGGAKAGNNMGLYNADDPSSKWAFEACNPVVDPVDPQGPALPYSTLSNPHYYMIQFFTGSAALADQGDGQKVKTATKNLTSAAQQWALIGDASGFQLRSAQGNYLCFHDSRFYTTSDASQAATLVLPATPHAAASEAGCFELRVAGEGQSMNQFGGSGAGRELGKYTAGDPNDPFYLVSATMEEPIYSTLAEPKYYFIQFCNSNNVLQAPSTAAGQNIVTAKVDPIDQQMWQIIGTKDNFQLRNRSGLYAVMTNGTGGGSARLTTSTTPDQRGFSLVQTTNATWAPNPEIKWNGYDGQYQRINQNGGANLGATLCLWSAGDPGNVIKFSDPDTYEYGEYKILPTESFSPKNPLTLWYTTSSEAPGVSYPWMEYALPIGNGELGAMVFGNVYKERIQFNEKTLWRGSGNGVGVGGGNRTYMNFGDIFVEDLSADIFGFGSTSPVRDYVRYLDIEEGIAGVRFADKDGTRYERRYLSSAPDQVIAAQYTAQGAHRMDLRFTMKPGSDLGASAVAYQAGEDQTASASFQGAMQLIQHAARLVVEADDAAQVVADAQGITVRNASTITLYLKGATNFDEGTTPDVYVNGKDAATVAGDVQEAIHNASTRGFEAVMADHVQNFGSLLHRVRLDLGLTTPSVTTEQLIRNYNDRATNPDDRGNDAKFLEALYFQYGRYLAISSNRKPIAMPNNLQGIWNDRGTNSPWNSDIHTNINVQMNYWPMESTNLSELHVPFLNYIIRGAQSAGFKEVARRYNDGYGWTTLTETSGLNDCSTFADNYHVANVWYTSHLWQHYRYTLDQDFLRQAFPIMWDAARFWMHRLIKDQGYDSATQNSGYRGQAYSAQPDGTWVAPNEYSPEQDDHKREDATAHSQQMISYLFENIDSAAVILGGYQQFGISQEQWTTFQDYLAHTDKGLHTEVYTANTALNGGWTNPRNGVAAGDTILREWKYSPYDVSNDTGHRHLSHLMALFPMDQITPESPYFEPAVNSLRLRGDAATGWSMGWKVNLWARAQDGDHAHTILHNALRHSTAYDTNAGAGGVYYNLFDSHSPFQIDGNFGVCSGVAEMLLQSHGGVIRLLPALPSTWASGSVEGLKAMGNFTVNETWEANTLTRATITSHMGGTLRVLYRDQLLQIQDTYPGETYEFYINPDGTFANNLVDATIVTVTHQVRDLLQGKGTKERIERTVDTILRRN